MNLPSSLALPRRNNLFKGRTALLLLALAAVIAGGIATYMLVLRPVAPPRTPTPATSPAAQVPVRPAVVVPAPVVYGPPAPDWVKHTPVPAPAAAPVAGAPAGAVPAPAVPLAATAVPGAAGAVVPGATATDVETPKSLDASVLFQREQYIYTSAGRRDPFQSLIDGKFQGSAEGGLVDVGDIHLVGIMWGSSDKFALVEDSRGRGYVLRVGDPVVNGYISGISKSELQIVQNAFGESQSMTIKLQPKEGDQNATRN